MTAKRPSLPGFVFHGRGRYTPLGQRALRELVPDDFSVPQLRPYLRRVIPSPLLDPEQQSLSIPPHRLVLQAGSRSMQVTDPPSGLQEHFFLALDFAGVPVVKYHRDGCARTRDGDPYTGAPPSTLQGATEERGFCAALLRLGPPFNVVADVKVFGTVQTVVGPLASERFTVHFWVVGEVGDSLTTDPRRQFPAAATEPDSAPETVSLVSVTHF